MNMMTMSLANAIRSIKQDEKWISKIIVGGIVYAILMLASFYSMEFTIKGTDIGMLICAIISIVTGLWITGFIFSSANKTINSDKFQMAELNEKNLMLTGLNTCAAILGWGIIFTIILSAIVTLTTLFYSVLTAIIALIIGSIGTDIQVVTIFIIILCALLGVVLGLYTAQFMNTSFALYLKRLKFRDLISFKKHFVIIKENQHANWTLIGKVILFSLAYLGITIGLSVTIVGLILVPFVVFAGYFVSFNLISQYAKQINIEKYLEA